MVYANYISKHVPQAKEIDQGMGGGGTENVEQQSYLAVLETHSEAKKKTKE
jgi:hypothetical protein